MIYGFLISGALRAAFALTFGLIVYALLSRVAAATRRFVLVLTLASAIVVPLVAAIAPHWTLDAPVALSAFARESANETAAAAAGANESVRGGESGAAASSLNGSPAKYDFKLSIANVWGAVALALLVRAALSHLRVRALVRRSTRVHDGAWLAAANGGGGNNRALLRVSSEIGSPAVAGLFRPTILIPCEALAWPVERCRLVLSHEWAHVVRHDVLCQLVAEIACALHWYNPLVWICARRFGVERELAADDSVLAAGVRPSRYAEELVAVATSIAAPSAALSMAERSSLEVRIVSILAARLARTPLGARGQFAVVGASTAVVLATACAAPALSTAQASKEPAAAPRVGASNDKAIQRVAEDEIEAASKEWAADFAAIVVLDPATGRLLANAGRAAGKSADVASTIAVAPGSTIKPIVVAAALEVHAITPEQRFECGPGPRTYGDKEIRDSAPNGTLDVAHLLAVSSNVGTSRIFDALGGDNLATWLHKFHFGESPRPAGAAAGSVPSRIVTGSYEGAVVAIGHGSTASPLQMLAAYGAIANDGVYHEPTLDSAPSAGERILSSETSRSVMKLLETAVADDSATGKGARVEGVHIVGKTGTAEWTTPDGHDANYASFVGIADLPSRRIVALIGIESSRADISGGKAAAPVFARLVKRIR